MNPQVIKSFILNTLRGVKMPEHWNIYDAFHKGFLKPFKVRSPKVPIEEDPPKYEYQEEIL